MFQNNTAFHSHGFFVWPLQSKLSEKNIKINTEIHFLRKIEQWEAKLWTDPKIVSVERSLLKINENWKQYWKKKIKNNCASKRPFFPLFSVNLMSCCTKKAFCVFWQERKKKNRTHNRWEIDFAGCLLRSLLYNRTLSTATNNSRNADFW